MEFILIPLALILASAGGILFIVWRKLPRLEELAETGSTNGASAESGWRHVFYDLCPEVWNWAKGVKVKEYKEMWLVETEKLLRRLRVVSLKMDRFSDSLIKKIRKRANRPAAEFESASGKQGPVPSAQREGNIGTGAAEFKKNEQRLIIEIAKNPKNAALYEELGDLYSGAGDYKDAKESYEAAIELNSNNEELKKKLSLSLEKLTPPK